MNIAVAEYLLPLVIGVTILQRRQILKHAGHGDVAGTNDRDLPAQVYNGAAGREFLT